jgi:hypothetical protein
MITGQMRTFFTQEIQESFTQMIRLSKMNYKNIVVILVINDDYDESILQMLFASLNIPILIIDYKKYNHEYEELMQSKMKNSDYNKLKQQYFEKNTRATREVYNIDDNLRLTNIQAHQLKVAIDMLLQYEKKNDITYDIMMKTRFDIMYPMLFFPHVPEGSIITKLLFDEALKERFLKKMDKYNIPINMEALIHFLKEQQVNEENCRVNFDMLDFTFGGHFCYNYKSLENINNGSNRILYLFNDFYFFGKRETFLTLESFSDEYCMKPTNIDAIHFYIPEIQLCIFCDNHDIDYIMYHPVVDGKLVYCPIR